ncbi:MAG: protease pro-enzyme activation domain-containing protein [Terriglobia bacterium]
MRKSIRESRRYVVLSSRAPAHFVEAKLRPKRPSHRARARVTVVLRPRVPEARRRALIEQLSGQFPRARRRLRPKELEVFCAADAGAVRRIRSFAREHGLKVVVASAARRSVTLEGTLAALGRAFQVDFVEYDHHTGRYRSHKQSAQVPAELEAVVEGVLGLDTRSTPEHHLHFLAQPTQPGTDPRKASKRYDFPSGATGTGQTVAIIELGGGFHPGDLQQYFRELGLPLPKVSVVEIDGQKNNPTPVAFIREAVKRRQPPSDKEEKKRFKWTIETTIDIELAGALASGAHLVVYFAPNTHRGTFNAFQAALNDRKHRPSVISCSWGAAEDDWGDENFVKTVMERVFQDALLKGVTICFSSGDDGDGAANHGHPCVHFPASSPYVLGCGGTQWMAVGSNFHEVVWNETVMGKLLQSTGGASHVFDPAPAWQASAEVPQKTASRTGRGVPDVAAKADFATGYKTCVGGLDIPMGGTSSAAPLWAALVARLNQKLRRPVGYFTSLLYLHPDRFRKAFYDVTKGNNGNFYRAAPGWDPCTGWGSPNGEELLKVLSRRGSRRG